MSSGRGPIQFAKQIALRRLDSHPAWPRTAYRLECEAADVYQDESGQALKELKDNGEIDRKDINVGGTQRVYFTRPETPIPEPEDEIQHAVRQFEAFLTTCGYFGNLVTYVALCKIHDELGDYITGFDVLPEAPRPYLLNNPGREPDAVVLLPDEKVPIEVYNGGDYLGTNTRKHSQLTDLSTNPDGSLPTNPILVNHRSDDDIKRSVRNMNGLVIDTGLILACENKRDEIQDVLETLHLERRIDFVPEMETADGVALDGSDYDDLSRGQADVDIIHPPSKLTPAADDLPDQFLQRIRGGIQLQYVNSIYREDHAPMTSDACFVLQEIYNILLREGGHTRQRIIDKGWDKATDRYRRLKSVEQRKPAILDETQSLLNRLRDERIITERNGELHARRAEHPQQDLTF
jgi:hypothetical protein